MLRAYAINFGFYSLRAMRYLYVPIVVIENGFSRDTLGWVLSIGIIPYLLLSDLMARLVRRFGKKIWLVIGFGNLRLLIIRYGSVLHLIRALLVRWHR
jgi:cyanate permease